MSNRIEDLTTKIVTPLLEENSCRLWDVVFEKEGAMHYLRILFDSVDSENDSEIIPLDLDKCEKLTPPLNRLMDAQEFIKQVDILEIGSPGLTRRLRHKEHFIRCQGKNIRIMKRKDDGKTAIVTGVLIGYDADNKTITIDTVNKEQDNTVTEGTSVSLKKCIRITLEEQPQ